MSATRNQDDQTYPRNKEPLLMLIYQKLDVQTLLSVKITFGTIGKQLAGIFPTLPRKFPAFIDFQFTSTLITPDAQTISNFPIAE
jgi:hypothetical protein